MSYKVFADIATRTGGEVYIGVVGPVRCGKSTFITKFMKSAIVPAVGSKAEQQRLVDELPQAGDGTAIMTTQPHFVPNKAVSVKVAGNAVMKLRMIDCVGYLVPGAQGAVIDGKTRLVKTPWSNDEMPFEKAAELGTKKVIKDHSTIAIAVTTDGTIGELPRENYLEAEERIITQLKRSGKPFVVVVNSRTPESDKTRALCVAINKKFGAETLAVDIDNMTTDHINTVFRAILNEFGVSGFRVTMPKWLTVLDSAHEIVSEAIDALKKYTAGVKKLSDNDPTKVFAGSTHFNALETTSVDIATGVITFNIVPKDDLYFRVLSGECGVKLESEQQIVAYIRHISALSGGFEKIRKALSQVEETGYGVVEPLQTDYKLERPQLHKAGRNYGIKLRATAPSLHIMKVDVATEVTPTVGTLTQSEEMLKHLQTEYETNATGVWDTPIFGRNLESIVHEGITAKTGSMPPLARTKMQKTLSKIVNNGRGGVICILL